MSSAGSPRTRTRSRPGQHPPLATSLSLHRIVHRPSAIHPPLLHVYHLQQHTPSPHPCRPSHSTRQPAATTHPSYTRPQHTLRRRRRVNHHAAAVRPGASASPRLKGAPQATGERPRRRRATRRPRPRRRVPTTGMADSPQLEGGPRCVAGHEQPTPHLGDGHFGPPVAQSGLCLITSGCLAYGADSKAKAARRVLPPPPPPPSLLSLHASSLWLTLPTGYPDFYPSRPGFGQPEDELTEQFVKGGFAFKPAVNVTVIKWQRR